MANEIKKNADILLKQAYREHYTSVYRYTLAKLKNPHECEDVVQETFIVYYKKLLSGTEIEYVKAFLLRTADNFIKKKYAQQKKAQQNVSLDQVITLPSHNEDVDERLTFEEYSRQISAALSDKEANMFSLRYIEELKIEDVADRMNMSIPAVTTSLSRMRNKIRKMLGDIM